MHTVAAEPGTDTAQAVIDAATHLAATYQDTPGGYRRLRPELVAVIDAVLAHQRTTGATS